MEKASYFWPGVLAVTRAVKLTHVPQLAVKNLENLALFFVKP